MLRGFQQVDVFGAASLTGNPVAVVTDAGGLATEDMQRFTRWMNLSETAFLLPATSPDADYRVRIFTLADEVPFAGHPTLGACHAWLEAGGVPHQADTVVQECGSGLVPVSRADGMLAFAAPPLLRSGPVEEGHTERLATFLGIDRGEIVDAQWADNGPGWVAVLLRDADAVLALNPAVSADHSRGMLAVGVVGPDGFDAECAVEVRAFFSDEHGTVREDPVTGSINAALGQWLVDTGRVTTPYVASQGARLGRAGRVRVGRDDEGTIWVGGTTTTVIHGEAGL